MTSRPSRRTVLTTSLSLGAAALLAQPAAAATGDLLMNTAPTTLFTQPSLNAAVVSYNKTGKIMRDTGAAQIDGFVRVTCEGKTGWAKRYMFKQVAMPTTAINQTHSYGGRSALYHIRAQNLDWTRPVGIAWYFDGDYSFRGQLIATQPSGTRMLQLQNEANRRNFVLIAVETPDFHPNYGYTWWRIGAANGEWFRALAKKIQAQFPILRTDKQWVTGWSGGAEFTSMQLMSIQQLSWWRDGGATMCGGGEAPDRCDVTNPTFRGIDATWHVAADDDYTAAKTGWSARAAATRGEYAHRVKHDKYHTRLVISPAGDGAHHSYAIPALMASDMDLAGYKPVR